MLVLMGTATQAKIKPCCIELQIGQNSVLTALPLLQFCIHKCHRYLTQQECGASIPALSIASNKGVCLFHWIYFVSPLSVNLTSTMFDCSFLGFCRVGFLLFKFICFIEILIYKARKFFITFRL